MASNVAETLIGAVVLAAAGGFLVYGAQTADVGGVGGSYYDLTAPFRKAEGLNIGADVRISGVKVGSVTGMALDSKTYEAVATLSIEQGYNVPDDSSVTIASEGLLGGSFVAIEPGSSDFFLGDGDAVEYTQGSVNLLDLLSKTIAE
ncbi:MAG: outer membrane lipid asymmetry maintenance protein MlaD [Pseudomonadota bacterium]